MDCFEIKPLIGFFLDRSLSQNEMQEMEEHIQSCPSCLAEYQHLEKLERLVGSTNFATPSDEYWLGLPRRITRRLNFQRPVVRDSSFTKLIQALIFDRKFQVGFATTAVIAVLFFTFLKITAPEPEPIRISLKQENTKGVIPEKEAQEPNHPTAEQQLQAESVVPEQSAENEFELESIASSSMPAELEDGNDDEPTLGEIFVNRDLLQLQTVESKPLKYVSRELLTSGQQIFPVPFTDYIPPRQILPSDDDDDPVLRTFALDTRKIRPPKSSEAPDLPAEVKSIRSGFLETLRIVHESSS